MKLLHAYVFAASSSAPLSAFVAVLPRTDHRGASLQAGPPAVDVADAGMSLSRNRTNSPAAGGRGHDPAAWCGDIRVLYEDERLIAIDKPAGVAHHDDVGDGDGDGVGGAPGMLSLYRLYQSRIAAGDDVATPPGGRIVGSSYSGRIYGTHRLDRATTGVLLLAKDAEAAGLVSRAFRKRSVTKYYCAVSAGKAKKKQGRVEGDMVRARRGAWKLTREKEDPAKTEYWTAGLGHMCGGGAGGSTPVPRTFILFHPWTGRTHQLRVAAKSMGLPIIADAAYGGGGEAPPRRIFLHAAAMHLDLVEAGLAAGAKEKYLSVFSPPPFDYLWDGDDTDGDKICLPVLRRLLEKSGADFAVLESARLTEEP